MRRVYFCLVVLMAVLRLDGTGWAQANSPATAADAQRTAEAAPIRVAGVIRTAQGIAVPGAPVRILHVASGQAWITSTDEEGKFALPEMPAGRYRIEARQLGLGTASREVELAGNLVPQVEMTLRLGPPAGKGAETAAESSSTPAAGSNSKEPAGGTSNPEGMKKKHHRKEAAETGTESSSKPAAAKNSVQPAGEPPNPEGAKKGHHHKQATETSAESPSQPATAKTLVQPVPETARAEGPKKRHHNKQSTEVAPSDGKVETAKATQVEDHKAGGGRHGRGADSSGAKKSDSEFQTVEPTGQTAAVEEQGQGDAVVPLDSSPLGQGSSSSDAFLMTGTVGRGASVRGASSRSTGVGGVGGTGLVGEEGGIPGQPDENDPSGTQRSARGEGRHHHSRRTQAQAPDNGGLGEGLEALGVRERLRRLGSNRVRFGFFNRYDNSIWDAKPFRLGDPHPPRQDYYREQFGIHFGGPFLIPKIYNGRERTFFFVNYQLDRNMDPLNQAATVPLPEERNGDFTARGAHLFDPLSNMNGPRTALGSVIPASRLNPAAVALLKFIPLPNLPGLRENFHLLGREPQFIDRVDARILHTISPRLNFQASYNLLSIRQRTEPVFPSLPTRISTRAQSVTLGLTQNWTPRLLHETRVNWTRNRVRTLGRFAFGENVAGELGITGVSTAPVDFGVPLITFNNFDPLLDTGPGLNRNQTLRVVDSISYILSKHTLRGGFEVRRMQTNSLTDPAPRGQFSFSGFMTNQLDANGQPIDETGFDFADFLLGFPAATSKRFGSSSNYLRNWGFVAYLQDDWRVHPRFTFQYGVRWELATPLVEKFGHLANLDVNSDITAVALVLPGQVAPFSGHLPPSLIRPDYTNVAPRIGIAWRPVTNPSVVVRAGYGTFYNESIYNQLASSMIDQPPFAQSQTLLTSATQILTLQHGFPPSRPELLTNTVAVDPNYRVGYAQIWNASVEAQLRPSWVFEATYMGTKGTHLDLLRAPNRGVPGPSRPTSVNGRPILNAIGFTLDTFGASSIYHALQLRLQRRMAHGFAFQTQYTFGKSIDNASSIGISNPFFQGQVVVQDDHNFRAERGLSVFDVRHQFRTWYSYELPFGERKRWLRHGWLSSVFGNWQISGVTTIMTGTPFTARVNGPAGSITGTGANFPERADQIGNPNLPSGQRSPSLFFNTAAFVRPPAGRFGNAGRGTIVGPGITTFDVALGHRLRFGKDQRYRLHFRWEVQNLTNTPNFLGLHTLVGADDYGTIRGARPMRTMDFLIRMTF